MSHVFTSALLDRFRAHLIDEERSSATIAKYLHDVGAFFAFAGDVPIDKELVLRWKHALPERCKITTANAALSALNHKQIQFVLFVMRNKQIVSPKLNKRLFYHEI